MRGEFLGAYMCGTDFIKVFLIMMGAAVCLCAHAAPVSLPHTFTAGSPARAAEVNENFAVLDGAIVESKADLHALELRVDVLESAAVGGAGRPAYYLVDAVSKAPIAVALYYVGGQFLALTSSGYSFLWPGISDASLSMVQYFASADCSGDAYLLGGTEPFWMGSVGQVLNSTQMLVREEVAITLLSRRDASGGCVAANLSGVGYGRLVAHDAQVSGVATFSLQLAVTP